MMIDKKKVVVAISILCIATCVSDLIALYLLGRQFPGYSHISDTISMLGSPVSPASNIASLWWVIIGIVFIAYAAGFYTEYRDKGSYALIAAILIAIYGLGEGLGSGLFKVYHHNGAMTLSTLIHDAVGGIGIVAVLAVPLVVRKVISGEKHDSFYFFSGVIFLIGIVSSLLFLARYTGDNILHHYTGIWQRMTLVNTYIYFVVVAIVMIRPDRVRDHSG